MPRAKRWRAAGAACLMLAACATPPAQQTTRSDAPEARIPPPSVAAEARDRMGPPPPPPPPSALPTIGGALMSQAQRAPQPMPGDVDRERYQHEDTNPVRQVAEAPVSTFSIDVDTASYANVRRMLNAGRLPPRDAVRTEELINYFRYDYPLPAQRTQPFSTFVAVAPSPWAEGREIVHIGLQGYHLIPRERPALNLVLLIDVSGSMGEENKLPLALRGFRELVDQLRPQDRIAIAVYAGAAGEILPPTPGNEKARIIAAFENLQAGGSTAGGEGLRLAYALAERHFNRNAINRVMIATDGDFNVGINDPQQLEDFVTRQRETGIYLSVLGFGGGNYNDALMQRLAQNGNGVAAYIDTFAEARRVLRDEIAAQMFPIANDVKIQVEFNPRAVAEYRLIGYETRMLNREDFNNDRVDAGEIGAGHAVTAIYEITRPGGRTLTDPLRYQAAPTPSAGGTEIAFLRVRYKLPGESQSRLIERAITPADRHASLAAAPEATRWAGAVASFGQMLREDPFLDEGFAYDDVIALAQGARGRDEDGWRAEFVQLARAAQSAAGLPKLQSQVRPEPPRPIPAPRPR